MPEATVASYDDDGKVEHEATISTEDAKFLVVKKEGIDEPEVYEFEPDVEKGAPKRRLA